MAALPWMKFFPSDWLGDTKLSLCKPSTRGIWMDLICRMHDADTGTITGSWERIASLLRCTVDELKAAADDLYRCDVGDVVIGDEVSLTSRRITRDIAKRKACSEAGKRGGGNPALRTFKGRDKGTPKHPSDICTLTSDSVSGSSEGGVGEWLAVREIDRQIDRQHNSPLVIKEIWEAYPANGRTGFRAARLEIDAAIERIRLAGTADPDRWLLARVREYASSAIVRSGYTVNAARWFANGNYDDPAEAWNRVRASKDNGHDDIERPLEETPEQIGARLDAVGRKWGLQ